MELAFLEAALAVGNTDPNPPVGAVVVDPSSGKVLSSGHTLRAGLDHAEVCAIQRAAARFGEDALRGAHLYVTLEPCSHHGKTPPCSDLIIRSGIARVVIACTDPTDKVAGIAALHHAGIETELLGVSGRGDTLYDEAAFWTLGGFFHKVKTGRPRIFLKWAQTKNGFLAPEKGPSGAISSSLSKETVYRWRRLLHATLATPGTVASDQPRLTARYTKEKLGLSGFTGKMLDFSTGVESAELIEPPRFFMAPAFGLRWSREDLSVYAQNQKTLGGANTWFFDGDAGAKEARASGLDFFQLSSYDDLEKVFEQIGSTGALQVLVEAGPLFADKIYQSGMMDVAIAYLSPHEAPWEPEGRGFFLSDLVRQGREALSREGFEVIYDQELEQDRLLVFR